MSRAQGTRAITDEIRAQDTPARLAGVGPRRAALLAAAGIHSVRDLLLIAPLELESFPPPQPILDVGRALGNTARIAGKVARMSFSRFGRRSLLRIAVEDQSGRIDVLFFNQVWLRERFKVGEPIEVLGRAVDAKGTALTCLRLGTAEKPLPAAGELVARYPTIPGISPGFLADLCQRAEQACAPGLMDPLESSWLEQHRIPDLARCVRDLHRPMDMAAFHGALRRVALERALELEARIAMRRAENATRRAPVLSISDAEERALVARFPYALTAGQRRISSELRDDLSRAVPMRRLLQGDVGSGKTALGLYASLLCAASGYQSAFMAPTELLAEQHYLGLRALCSAAGLETCLLSGSLGTGARREALEAVASGRAQIVFGTHALFSEAVRFQRLGLAVIDEQQRFGVEQRQRLAGKGLHTHVLLMSATPIPRTLALTMYGDLDLSILREKPPGRGPVSTLWVRRAQRAQALARMQSALEAGQRMYWVVPRIGETPEEREAGAASQGSSAEARLARLASSPLAKFGLELVHGRLPPDERAARLERFRRGEVQILVATTVIEVGVDVPEATVMVIESAERLGLAQMHQLRGRIGRSPVPGACFLYGKPKAAERFLRLEQDSDGFSIAEADLLQRGMGELCGVRQAGASEFSAAAPEESLALARALLSSNPLLRAEYPGAPAAFDS